MTDIPTSTRARDAGLAGWPLLERDAELGALTAAVDAAHAGRGGVVLVRAAAGLGKTRLLGAAADHARAHAMMVLPAAGSVLERDFPFGVVLRMLERWIRAATEPERARAFEGSAALAQPMLLGGQAVEQALAAGSEASLVHALQWLVVNLSAERPVVLIADDLHWADAQSIRLLIQLAARIEELGVLVVAAARPREPGAQTELLDQLTASANVRLVEPRALSDVASAALVRGETSRADAFVRSCFEQTGGNPFLLSELLRALAADGVAGTDDADAQRVRAIGPEAVAHSVAATLARLGGECAALATAVAVLDGGGDDTDPHVAALLAGLDGPAASRAAAALQDAGLLDDGGTALRFRHPLLRRAVYERPAPAARAALHRTAARLLVDRAAPHDVASHLVLTHGAEERWAVDVLRVAAREASALSGHAAAARLLRRALDEPPAPADRPAVLEEAALAAVRAGAQDAVPALMAAIDAAAAGRDRAALWLVLARTAFQRGEMRESVDAADRGLAALDGAGAEESLALELEAARNAASLWTPAGAETVAARFAASAAGDAPPRTQGEREALAWLAGLELLRGEDRERTLTFARRAWDGGAYLREGTGDAAAMGAMVSALLRSGAWDEAFAVLDALIDDARRRASPLAYATWQTTRGTGLLHLGRLAEAERDLEDALAARALGWDQTAPIAIESLVTVLLEQDRLGDAAAVLDTAATLEGRFATGPMWASVLAARGRHALASGDAQAARDHFLAAGRFTREVLRTDNPGVVPWRSEAALAERQLGDLGAARALAEEEVAAARRFGAPRPLAVALRAQAVVAGGGEGPALAAAAARAAQDGGAVLEHARALGTLGALLRAGRRRSEAQEHLRRALDLAAERGAHALERTLRAELVAAGGRPRRARTHGPGSLTAGEQRVAQLAADGLTNRQIADALFVTPKAIGFHLGNVYRKLGIGGREHLRAALERPR